MKAIWTLFCLISVCSPLQAQTELTIPYDDAEQSVFNTSHVPDRQGNIYLLSYVTDFYSGPGASHGLVTYGSLITKIDRNQQISWQRLYPTSPAAGVTDLDHIPATQIFWKDEKILVPFNRYMGSVICDDAPGTLAYTYHNGILLTDSLGTPLADDLFADDTGCGITSLQQTQQNLKLSHFFTVVKQGSKTYIEKRNALWGLNKKIEANYLDGIFRNSITYDTFAQNFVVYGRYGSDSVLIVDTTGAVISNFLLPHTIAGSFIQTYRLFFGKEYYLFNYQEQTMGGTSESKTAIYTKAGQLISLERSGLINDAVVTIDNKIWCVGNIGNPYAYLDTPVVITQMNVYQNIIRQQKIGLPYTVPEMISLDNTDIFVTGTVATGNYLLSNKVADRLYYYHASTSEIPSVHYFPDDCANISLYPNPVVHTLHATSNSYDLTHNAAVQLYDIVGRKMGSYKWQQRDMDIDMRQLPAGVYMVCIVNNGKKCIRKVTKR